MESPHPRSGRIARHEPWARLAPTGGRVRLGAEARLAPPLTPVDPFHAVKPSIPSFHFHGPAAEPAARLCRFMESLPVQKRTRIATMNPRDFPLPTVYCQFPKSQIANRQSKIGWFMESDLP